MKSKKNNEQLGGFAENTLVAYNGPNKSDLQKFIAFSDLFLWAHKMITKNS